ncbi:hypothetical protein DT019_03100 [Streptomyces sp. SDr-06]|uniref:DUF6907 domain-containing protein n=1 Tax=Streptomyces sp. SDr-06 TaxID=2267702 RepID=UPI000DEB25E2|nr:hypothetical protein [Streptomyces sp. SDr-06]RCH70491.1 hypothetical protein DT019_03100 [Streptomyces sp. SDr-06]
MSVASEHASPQPVSTPTSPASRLVPALVHGQRIFVECPSWCIVDHVKLHTGAVEDITHWSEGAGMQVLTMLDPRAAHSDLFARVNSDPAHGDPRMRAAHVLVGNESAVDAFLTPDMADELAADLVAFAAAVRRAARTARRANEASGVEVPA